MKVYVVMGNDYPDCVFSDEGAADRYVKAKTVENKRSMETGYSRRVYWRVYLFDLKDET